MRLSIWTQNRCFDLSDVFCDKLDVYNSEQIIKTIYAKIEKEWFQNVCVFFLEVQTKFHDNNETEHIKTSEMTCA